MKYLMIQGTSSDAGKSFLVMALCRIFANLGYKVVPFKAQNMSSNSDIINGLEIARIQSLQAFAAKTKPNVNMNPILLKPMSNYMSKVIVLGREYAIMHANDYYHNFVLTKGLEYVTNAIRELENEYDIMIIEGAGSPAEINLQEYDIANMRLANLLKANTIIIADIERGGCFASMLGTLRLINYDELVKGFIINRFRGDIKILKPAIDRFEMLTNKPILGVIPYISNLRIPSEDTLSLHNKDGDALVMMYPNAGNLSEIDVLLNTLKVVYANDARDVPLIILPPSRNLKADLEWLNDTGLADWLRYCVKKGRKIIGIEEGYAMLGNEIGNLKGLGILDASFKDAKRINKYAEINISNKTIKCFINVYFEIKAKNAKELIAKIDDDITIGLIDNSQNVIGYSAYGMMEYIVDILGIRIENMLDREIDMIANIVKNNIDMDKIFKIIGLS